MQSARWAEIGREILFSARSELYMNLPFLDGALASLPVRDGFDTSSLATDAKSLFFSGAWLAQRFERLADGEVVVVDTLPAICTRCFTVCCGIRPKCTAVTAIYGRLRAILRSRVCSTA